MLTPPRWQYAVGGLLALILVGGLGYCRGVEVGALNEKLSSNKAQIDSSDRKTDSVQIRTDSARMVSNSILKSREALRAKVRIVRDSIFVRDTVYVSSDISDLIRASDSTIAAQQRSLALQDTLIANLRSGIALRDTRISILEHAKRPRFSKGLQLGVGYCAGVSRGPCGYVGYGVSVRLP